MLQSNPELELAGEFLSHTDCNVFLTGKAGTGKTTFLKNLKKTSAKRMIVTAPTGVAAINAGGVTLHSFFQLPFSPFVPGNEAYGHDSQRRFNKEKINIIKSLDLLVIDEISMVRADLLDGVDSVLRRYRRSNVPFGGVQLLMIGDLFQLPPVVKEAERRILQQYYDTAYFFSSNALLKTELLTIELKSIYRQSDGRFIDLLNCVRDNINTTATLDELNKRCIVGYSADEGCITLCSHNRNADAINGEKLEEIANKTHHFEADIEGTFPEHTYPTPATLALKVGAQVMFVRNDTLPDKRYFNGKIGTITAIKNDEVWVKCPDDTNQIIVEPVAWDNVEYKLEPESGEIKENKIGSFEQFPLKLAWAITIHKSQGLTFDKAIIDAQAAFAHGQVYVALSRCRTLEGLILSSPLAARSLKTDAVVVRFTKEATQDHSAIEKLAGAKIIYQHRLLLDCFDFSRLRYLLGNFTSPLSKNLNLVQIVGIADIFEFQKMIVQDICSVGENFKRQLQGLFSSSSLPAKDDHILERLSKASGYFQEKLENAFLAELEKLKFETDNKEILKKLKAAFKKLAEEGAVKLAAVKCCRQGFSPSDYLRSLSAAEIDFRKKKEKTTSVDYTEDDITHPELFQTLRQWRTEKANEENIAPFQVLHQKTLIQIIVHLPDSMAALKKIKGIGQKLAERYGEQLVSMVSDYRKDKSIEEVVLPSLPMSITDFEPVAKESVKKKTKDITLEMFEKGLDVMEIAEKRSLTRSTIEGHLCFFISTGRVRIESLLSSEKIAAIEAVMVRLGDIPFNEIKANLGNDSSYGEIKMVHAYFTHKEGKKEKVAEDQDDVAVKGL